jgi:hypothetical protein
MMKSVDRKSSAWTVDVKDYQMPCLRIVRHPRTDRYHVVINCRAETPMSKGFESMALAKIKLARLNKRYRMDDK